MTYISVKCPVCGSENVSKNGSTKSGKQQYICNNKNCKKSSFILNYTYNTSKPEIKNKEVYPKWAKQMIFTFYNWCILPIFNFLIAP